MAKDQKDTQKDPPAPPPGGQTTVTQADADTTGGRTVPHVATPQNPSGALTPPPSPGGDSAAAKQLELEERERELARRAADLDRDARAIREAGRMLDQREEQLFIRQGSAASAAAVMGTTTLLDTRELPAPSTFFEQMAVDRAVANKRATLSKVEARKAADRETVLRTHDFETIAKIRTAYGFVPNMTRIPAGTMAPAELSDLWARKVVRPYQPPPPPEAPAAPPPLDIGPHAPRVRAPDR